MRSVFFWYILFWNTITKIIKQSPQDLQDLGSHSCLATDTWYDCCFIGSGKISATMPHKSAKTDILAAARRSDAAGPGDIHHSQQIVQGSLRTFQQTEMLKNKQENQTKKPKSMVVFWDQSVLVRDTCDILGDGLLQTILLNGNYLHLEITLSLMKTTTLFPCRKKVSVSLCMHAETNNVLHRPTGIFILNVNRV